MGNFVAGVWLSMFLMTEQIDAVESGELPAWLVISSMDLSASRLPVSSGAIEFSPGLLSWCESMISRKNGSPRQGVLRRGGASLGMDGQRKGPSSFLGAAIFTKGPEPRGLRAWGFDSPQVHEKAS